MRRPGKKPRLFHIKKAPARRQALRLSKKPLWRRRRGRSPFDFHSCKPALPASRVVDFACKIKGLARQCFSCMKNTGRKATWLFPRKATLPPAKPPDTNKCGRGCSPSNTFREFFDSLSLNIFLLVLFLGKHGRYNQGLKSRRQCQFRYDRRRPGSQVHYHR